MTSVLRYPNQRHLRRQTPGSLSPYSRYKPFLKIEFGGQCVYCRRPDTILDSWFFGADHYVPVSVDPSIECDYANLFYACNRCNRYKGAFWPDADHMAAGRFVPNPCLHVMYAHVRLETDDRVLGRTVAGRFFIDLLELNGHDMQSFRKLARATIRALDRTILEGEAVLAESSAAGMANTPEHTRAVADLAATRAARALWPG